MCMFGYYLLEGECINDGIGLYLGVSEESMLFVLLLDYIVMDCLEIIIVGIKLGLVYVFGEIED